MSSGKSAIVVGGGLAGLSAALNLDALGYQVKLLEKKSLLGGRATSFPDRTLGIDIDNGQHLLIGAYHETLAFSERIGAKRFLEFKNPTQVPIFGEDGHRHVFNYQPRRFGLGALLALGGFSGVGVRDKLSLLRLLPALVRATGRSPLRGSSFDWLRRCGQSEKAIKNFWEVFVLATLNDAGNIAAAENLVAVLARSFFSGSPLDGCLIFPKTTLKKAFIDPALDFLEARGHEVVSESGVKEIRILEGKARSLVLENGQELRADLYVLAVPPFRLLKMLPLAFIENHENFKKISSWNYSPIASIHFYFKNSVMQDEFIGAAGTRTHWFFNKGVVETNLGKLQHVVGVVSAAYDFLNSSRDDIVELAFSDFCKIYPAQVEKPVYASVNIERQATLSLDSKTNAERPPQKILENLYIVGDWTKTGLPATIESAVISSRLMVEILGAK